MSEPSSIRIGNAERESAVAALDTHLREGRLDADEYGERYARVTTARTQDELTALFTDLPQPHPKLSGVRAPRNRESRFAAPLRRLQSLPTWLLILGAIALVSAVRAPWLFGGVFFWVFVFPWMFGGRRGFYSCGGKRSRHQSHTQPGYTYPTTRSGSSQVS